MYKSRYSLSYDVCHVVCGSFQDERNIMRPDKGKGFVRMDGKSVLQNVFSHVQMVIDIFF